MTLRANCELAFPIWPLAGEFADAGKPDQAGTGLAAGAGAVDRAGSLTDRPRNAAEAVRCPDPRHNSPVGADAASGIRRGPRDYSNCRVAILSIYLLVSVKLSMPAAAPAPVLPAMETGCSVIDLSEPPIRTFAPAPTPTEAEAEAPA